MVTRLAFAQYWQCGTTFVTKLGCGLVLVFAGWANEVVGEDDGLDGTVCFYLIEDGNHFARTAKRFKEGGITPYRFQLNIFFLAKIQLDGIDAISLRVKEQTHDGVGEVFVFDVGHNAFVAHIGSILNANICANGKRCNGLQKNFNHKLNYFMVSQ